MVFGSVARRVLARIARQKRSVAILRRAMTNTHDGKGARDIMIGLATRVGMIGLMWACVAQGTEHEAMAAPSTGGQRTAQRSDSITFKGKVRPHGIRGWLAARRSGMPWQTGTVTISGLSSAAKSLSVTVTLKGKQGASPSRHAFGSFSKDTLKFRNKLHDGATAQATRPSWVADTRETRMFTPTLSYKNRALRLKSIVPGRSGINLGPFMVPDRAVTTARLNTTPDLMQISSARLSLTTKRGLLRPGRTHFQVTLTDLKPDK